MRAPRCLAPSAAARNTFQWQSNFDARTRQYLDALIGPIKHARPHSLSDEYENWMFSKFRILNGKVVRILVHNAAVDVAVHLFAYQNYKGTDSFVIFAIFNDYDKFKSRALISII